MKKFIIASSLMAMVCLSSCTVSVNGNEVKFNAKKEGTERVNIEPEKATKLDVNVEVGKINIEYGKTKTVDVECSYVVRGTNDKKVSSAIENLKFDSKVKGDTVYLSVDNDDFDTRFVNVTTDLDIVIPSEFSDFTIESDVGDVKLNDLIGTFDIQADVGNVFLDNIKGDFEISADVGNVNCSDISITDDSEIVADVGNVDVLLKKVAKCNLKITADVGDIDLDTNGLSYEEKETSKDYVGKKSEVIIDNKCTAKLSASVGSVKMKK